MVLRDSSRGARTAMLVPVMMLAATTALAAGQVGEPAADFNLENLEGGFVTFSEHLGEVVVLSVIGYG